MNIFLEYRSPLGAKLDLANNPDFVLSDVSGLTEAAVDIASYDVAAVDGDIINSVRTQPRSITLFFTILPNRKVEEVKRKVLKVIKPKQTGVLHWEQDGRSLEIEGTVETVQMPRFTNAVVMQVSLYCAQPYWEDAEYMLRQIEYILGLHHFELAFPQGVGVAMGEYNLDLTRSFNNDGDADVGMDITIIATGNITNPKLERSDGLYFGLTETMEVNDRIDICTVKGKKTVTKNGVNIMNKVIAGSTWLQLEVGENVFTISEAGGSANMYFTFEYKRRYV